MIEPTVGRVVWYHPAASDPGGVVPGDVQAALIAHVWDDRCVNLAVFDSNGGPYSRTSVHLAQDNEAAGPGEAEWIPYQKGQAAKAEQLESELANASKS